MTEDRTPKILLDGTIDNGRGEKTHVAVVFVPPDEPTPLNDIYAWVVNFSVDNTTLTIDLPSFLKISDILSESVTDAARQAGLIPPK